MRRTGGPRPRLGGQEGGKGRAEQMVRGAQGGLPPTLRHREPGRQQEGTLEARAANPRQHRGHRGRGCSLGPMTQSFSRPTSLPPGLSGVESRAGTLSHQSGPTDALRAKAPEPHQGAARESRSMHTAWVCSATARIHTTLVLPRTLS